MTSLGDIHISSLQSLASFLALGGLPAYVGEKKGGQVTITSPRHGEIVGSNVEPTYPIQKGTKGTLQGLTPGKHQITIKPVDHDHEIFNTSDSIEEKVK